MTEGERSNEGSTQSGTGGSSRTGRSARRLAAIVVGITILLVAVGALNASATGGAATVETEAPSGVGRTVATLHASVNPNGTPVTECSFEYGTSEAALSNHAECSYLPGELETPVPVEASLSGLPETTTYYFRIHVNGAGGESTGSIRTFTTFPTVPAVSNEAPVVGHTSATLRASITADESEVTECHFEWGTAPNQLTQQTECSPATVTGSEPTIVSGSIGGLSESTVYYYRVVAGNAFGSEHSSRGNLETLPSLPKAMTSPSANPGHTTATLKGSVDPNGAAITSCHFEWGSASVEEHVAACEQTELGSGEAPVTVSANLTGLAEGTSYHYALVATNTRGSDTGGTDEFTTLPSQPKSLIGHPQQVSDESAVVKGHVNPQGETVTECRFEYGTTVALGSKVPCSSLPGSGERYVLVGATISGLSPQTGYYVRLRVANASGVAYTRVEPFTTYAAGLPPVVKKTSPRKGSPAGGTVVTVTGENLENAVAVTFGETSTTQITADSPFSLTVIAPPSTTGKVDILVTTASGGSAPNSGDRFTYSNPIITGLSPIEGPISGGTEVTVTGSGFEPGAGGTTFLFGKTAAGDVECASTSSCTLLTPAASKHGPVKVKAVVGGKGSKTAGFTYGA